MLHDRCDDVEGKEEEILCDDRSAGEILLWRWREPESGGCYCGIVGGIRICALDPRPGDVDVEEDEEDSQSED